MKICFLRHGPAVPRGTKGISEADRPLTPRGRKKTSRAMRGIRALDLKINAIYSSPLRRARETAEILSKVIKKPGPKTTEHLLPESSPGALVEFLKKTKAPVVALVGHEPAMTAALAHFLGTERTGSYELKKAGIALVSVPKWAPRPSATLELLLTPAALRAIGR
jgi:phosphohistidine phosphatase